MHARTQIKLSAAERVELEAVISNRNSPQKHVWRAKIVLLTADGHGTAEIMRRTGKAKTVIWRWQERFGAAGIAGLWRDKTRPSRIPPLTPEVVERVATLTLAGPPPDATHWTGAAMAGAVGVSVSSVQRIWRAHGLQPHRVSQFKLSNDPQFIAKLRDIVGLYVNPPDHAIVLSIDEKSQIQALDRTQPMLPMKKRQAGTMTHDYKRHGITTLFAALDVLEGKVIGQCMKRQSATKTERPRHPRQLRRTQASQSSGMARSPSALCLPLHSDLGILAQCNRRAIRSPIQAAPQARRLSFAPGNSRMRSTAFSTTNANPKPFIWTKDPRQDHRCRKRGHQVLDSIH